MSEAQAAVVAELDTPATEPAEPATEPTPVILPDDHPLLRTLEANKAEIKTLKQGNQNLTIQEAAARQQASQFSEQVTVLRTEIAQLQAQAENNEIAVQYGLQPQDAAMLAQVNADRDAKEQLAARLAAGYNVTGETRNPSPVPELGRVVTTDSDNATVFARFAGQNLRTQ
jgi:hypothetical protein